MAEFDPLSAVASVYKQILEDVISNVREDFVEEGIDEQVLQDLKRLWETKVAASKCVPGKRQDINISNGPVRQLASQPIQPVGTSTSSTASSQSLLKTKMVSIAINLTSQTDEAPMALTIQVPSTALEGGRLQKALTGPVLKTVMSLPRAVATSLLQQHVDSVLLSQRLAAAQMCDAQDGTDKKGQKNKKSDDMDCAEIAVDLPHKKQKSVEKLHQVDGPSDFSDDSSIDESDSVVDIGDDDEEIEEEGDELLDSNDDDDDFEGHFDTDNVLVCLFEKVHRSRNRWQLRLKDGIMNLNGIDYVFHKANVDTKW